VETVKKPAPPLRGATVRTRRAYFDFKFGQLHVRTAFPTTGGFDEQMPLFCLHGASNSSRIFARFLPEIADVRSVYAPDLPGCGESDPAPVPGLEAAAECISGLTDDLRLRQIDVLGIADGAAVAVKIAAARPDRVRRLILGGLFRAERLPRVTQQSLVLLSGPDTARAPERSALPNARFIDIAGPAEEIFDADPKGLAAQIAEFLTAGA
jgi:pimeloyl-ACP methyl ester carboxylesterase